MPKPGRAWLVVEENLRLRMADSSTNPGDADKAFVVCDEERTAFRVAQATLSLEQELVRWEQIADEERRQRNHAFAFLRLILDDPYTPIPPGVQDAIRELVQDANLSSCGEGDQCT